MFYLRGFENAFALEAANLAGASASATITGPSLDFGSCDDQIYLEQLVASITGTYTALQGLAGKLQQTPDNVNWTDCNPIVASPATVSVVNDATNKAIPITGYMRDYRYVRYVGTITGTTPVVYLTAIITGMKKKV